MTHAEWFSVLNLEVISIFKIGSEEKLQTGEEKGQQGDVQCFEGPLCGGDGGLAKGSSHNLLLYKSVTSISTDHDSQPWVLRPILVS